MEEIDYKELPRENILCVDMKSFFASIEAVDRGLDPLKVCLAVVGDKKRQGAVILAASPMLKKKYKIKTGNRLYEIPGNSEIKIVNARMGLYLRRSLEITLLFREFVPLEAIHVYSIDESWLKLDGTEKTYGDKIQLARRIKSELKTRFGLPSSMGIGPNMFLAKVAMDVEGKKKGLVEWTYQDIEEKLWPIKLEDCWGIGSRIARHFKRIGISTMGDLAQLPLNYLERKFGIMGSQLYYHARGVDLSKVEGHYKDKHKSMGRGITLFRDYTDQNEIKTVIFELAEEATQRARENSLTGKTVSLAVSYSKNGLKKGFHVQRTLPNYTNSTQEVYRVAIELFRENYHYQPVRRLSLALGNLSNVSGLQLNLFTDKLREARLNETKDNLQNRYGYKALFSGKSLRQGSVRDRIKTTIGGHKSW